MSNAGRACSAFPCQAEATLARLPGMVLAARLNLRP